MQPKVVRFPGASLAAAVILTAAIMGSGTAAEPTSSPILETEISDVATLAPAGPHRLLVGGGFQGGIRVIDGDAGKVVGQIYSAMGANLVIDPENRYYYLSETMWTRGNRGVRQDFVSVYDDQLKLVSEINVPGRLISVPKSPSFEISADGRQAYVFSMQPAPSVAVVDLRAKKHVATVEVPGCGMVYPFGASDFGALCADGTLAVATRTDGKYRVTRSARFFDAERDPVFEESLVDRKTGQAMFISFSGNVHNVMLGANPRIEATWSLNEAAGLPPASLQTEVLAWRPGGARLAAWHKASGRLFVLMHPGMHWSHKEAGTEVWVYDIAQRKRIARYSLDSPGSGLAVTQDDSPLLFVTTGGAGQGPGGIAVLDALKGETLRQVPGVSGFILAVHGY